MLSNIKKPISVLLAFAVAVIPLSCKSLDPKLLEQTAAFDKGVTPMRVVVNTDSIKACFPGGWRDEKEWSLEDKKFRGGYRKDMPGVGGFVSCCSFPEQESAVSLLRNNLIFEKDSRNIFLSVLVRNIEWRTNTIWYLASIMGILNVFGFPFRSQTITIDMEAAVMNPAGKMIKIYKAQGKDTEYMAPYWGYMYAEKPAYIKALIAGCADLRKQIEADRENINKLIR